MKTIFILMDSLNRHYLECYGNSWVKTPNIDRLAARGVVFDNHYAGSLPCMPARREMMTGRLNFMETPWGSIEPFDDCLPDLLRDGRNVYSHLITDHYHYWEQNGHGYHNRFDTWEFLRGQEGDPWHPQVKDPDVPPFKGKNRRQDWINRTFMHLERDEDYPTPQCFMRAIDFLDRNGKEDNWHLHLEVFDPHEPFMCPARYRDMYGDTWDGYHFDWPPYAPVEEGEEAVEHVRKAYAGTLSMADAWLGRLLDKMDALDLWRDTNVVFTADHGHLLGEHGYWAKNYMLQYEEISHIPLIVAGPACVSGPSRRNAITATIDLMPTIMDLHGVGHPPYVQGRSLQHLFGSDQAHHDAVLFGTWGMDINMFDGRYTYCRQPREGSFAYNHTSMPTRYVGQWREPFREAEAGRFLGHTCGMPVFRVKHQSHRHHGAQDSCPIFDLSTDPLQESPIRDAGLEKELAAKMAALMLRYDAPATEFERVGLARPDK